MPKFRLRAWTEQTLYDHKDYLVEADTVEEAAEKLEDALEVAADQRDPNTGDSIQQIMHTRPNGSDILLNCVSNPTPDEIVGEEDGIAEIDVNGKKLRDIPEVERGPSFGQIMTVILDTLQAADRIDRKLNDPHGDGSGTDAQPPTGDSYNELWDALDPLRMFAVQHLGKRP